MTALQLNADIYRNLAVLSMLRKAAKYLDRLAKQMKDDPTFMSKEEYFAMLDRSAQGPSRSFDNVKELDRYIQNL